MNTVHITVNLCLFLIAAGLALISLFLMHGIRPSRPYRAMYYAQWAMTLLELATALVIAWAIVNRLQGEPVPLSMQWWLQTLMASALIGAGSVTAARAFYERAARQPQAEATAELIEEIKKQLACDGCQRDR